jgi:hypothetical protein
MRINIEYEIGGIKHSTGFLDNVNVRNISLQIGNEIEGNEYVARDVAHTVISSLRGLAEDGNDFAKNALQSIVRNMYGEFQRYEKGEL